MKRAFTSVVFALLTIVLFSQQATAGIHEKLVAEYIKLSGLEEVLSTFPEQLSAMSAQELLTSKTPEQDKKLYEMMQEAFDIDSALNELNTFLLGNTDVAFLHELNGWLESPLGQKIKNEELKSSGAEQQANLLRFMADLQTNPPPQQRITLIQNLEQTLHLSDLTTIIVIEMIQGMAQAVNLALPQEERQPEDMISEQVAAMAPMLKENFRQQMIMTSFFTYRNLSDEELQKYIGFYNTPLGQKEIEITGKALSTVLKQWFINVSEELLNPAQKDKLMT
jgi:hypothetical protein